MKNKCPDCGVGFVYTSFSVRMCKRCRRKFTDMPNPVPIGRGRIAMHHAYGQASRHISLAMDESNNRSEPSADH